MKRSTFFKSFFLLLVLFAVFVPVQTSAQVTTLFNTKLSPDGGKYTVTWYYTLLTDTTSAFYSPQFSIPPGFEYDAMVNTTGTATLKQVLQLTAVPKGTLTLQGLYGGTTDTSNVKVLRATATVQTQADTSFTFKLGRSAPAYRIKWISTTGGGRISSGKCFLTFVKQTLK